MSEETKSEYKKGYCPTCKKEINFSTKKKINYQRGSADSRVWCRHCKKWVEFSLET